MHPSPFACKVNFAQSGEEPGGLETRSLFAVLSDLNGFFLSAGVWEASLCQAAGLDGSC